jgi:hypothetical protein
MEKDLSPELVWIGVSPTAKSAVFFPKQPFSDTTGGSVFERLQQAQMVRIKIEAVSLDSTIVKVHPDGTGH